jgi:hypothetical protein
MSPMHDDGTRYRRLLCAMPATKPGIFTVCPRRPPPGRIYADGIHILVEMTGHSRDSLLSIASMRPAPIQVSYLGFLGSTGAEYIDYTHCRQRCGTAGPHDPLLGKSRLFAPLLPGQ